MLVKSLFAVPLAASADCCQAGAALRRRRRRASPRRRKSLRTRRTTCSSTFRAAARSRSCSGPTSRRTMSSASRRWCAGLLQRADLPPRDPRLHGAGRRSQGNGRRRVRICPTSRPSSPSVPFLRGTVGAARANSPGQRQQPVLHHVRAAPGTRRQLHRRRPSRCRAWTRSTRSRRASRRQSPTKIVRAYSAAAKRRVDARRPTSISTFRRTGSR